MTEAVVHQCKECLADVPCPACPEEAYCPWEWDDEDDMLCPYCIAEKAKRHAAIMAEMSETIGVCTCPECIGAEEEE